MRGTVKIKASDILTKIKKIKITYIVAAIMMIIGVFLLIISLNENKNVRFLSQKSEYRKDYKIYKDKFSNIDFPDDDEILLICSDKEDMVKVCEGIDNSFSYSYIFEKKYSIEAMYENIEYARKNEIIKTSVSQNDLAFIYFIDEYKDEKLFPVKLVVSDYEKNVTNLTETYDKYLNIVLLQKRSGYGKIASIFEIDEEIVKDTFANDSNHCVSLTVTKLIDFLENEIVGTENEKYLSGETVSTLKSFGKYCSYSELNKKRNSKELAGILGVSEDVIKTASRLKNWGSNKEMSITELIDFVNGSSTIKSFLDSETTELLSMATLLINLVNTDNSYDFLALTKMIGISDVNAKELLNIYQDKYGEKKTASVTPITFLENVDLSKLNGMDAEKLEKIRILVEAMTNGDLYSFDEMQELLQYLYSDDYDKNKKALKEAYYQMWIDAKADKYECMNEMSIEDILNSKSCNGIFSSLNELNDDCVSAKNSLIIDKYEIAYIKLQDEMQDEASDKAQNEAQDKAQNEERGKVQGDTQNEKCQQLIIYLDKNTDSDYQLIGKSIYNYHKENEHNEYIIIAIIFMLGGATVGFAGWGIQKSRSKKAPENDMEQ